MSEALRRLFAFFGLEETAESKRRRRLGPAGPELVTGRRQRIKARQRRWYQRALPRPDRSAITPARLSAYQAGKLAELRAKAKAAA